MDFTRTGDPFFVLEEPPTAEAIAAQAAWEVEDAERQRRITACGNREGGHAWMVEGTPEEPPWLECADCPAVGNDLLEDILDLVDGEQIELGGRSVHFGQELPGIQSSCFSIPVNVEVENIIHEGGPWGPTEYDVAISITDRAEATAQ